jgi:hypothetical protein
MGSYCLLKCYYNGSYTINFPFVPTSHYDGNGKLPIIAVASWMLSRLREKTGKLVLLMRP